MEMDHLVQDLGLEEWGRFGLDVDADADVATMIVVPTRLGRNARYQAFDSNWNCALCVRPCH